MYCTIECLFEKKSDYKLTVYFDENVYKELVDQAHEEIAQPQTHASAKEMAKKRTTKRRINKVKMNKRKTKKRV